MLIMGTLQIDRYISMDMFFGIDHDKHYNDVADAKRVATVLDQMSRQEISNTLSTYQLLPVYYYLNVLRDKKEPFEFAPFAKYIDIYLIELTGNSRQKLNEVAQSIVGETYPISSARAMRHAIITNLLSPYR